MARTELPPRSPEFFPASHTEAPETRLREHRESRERRDLERDVLEHLLDAVLELNDIMRDLRDYLSMEQWRSRYTGVEPQRARPVSPVGQRTADPDIGRP